MSEVAPAAPPIAPTPARAPRRGRTVVNIAANLSQFGANTAIAVFFTPYLVRTFGKEAYGLVPLAWTVTQYLSVLTLGLNGAVGRFITIALERGERDEANRLFNTSFFGSLALAALLAVPAFAFALGIDRTGFAIPPGYESEARLLFVCTVAAFLLNTIQAPFDTSAYARNRFELRDVVTLLGLLTRVGLVVLLFSLTAARVYHVGMGFLVAGVLTLIASALVWRYLTPDLSINLRWCSRDTLRRMLSTTIWIVVSHIGTLLFLAVDLLVINQTLGTVAAGLYQPILQWSVMLRSLAMSVGAVFGPTIVQHWARQDVSGMVAYTRRAIRFVGLAVALPAGLISGFAEPLLRLWLPEQYHGLGPLMALLTLHLSFNLGYLPLSNITIATNHVRVPGIVQVVAGAINLTLGLVLVRYWGMYGVAAAGAIVLTLRNVVFTPLYTAHVLKQPRTTFLREALPITGLAVLLAGGCWLLAQHVSLLSWPRLIGAGLGVTIVYAGAVALLLSRDDRAALLAALRRKTTPHTPNLEPKT